jgi:HK97 gp10 family phage protein
MSFIVMKFDGLEETYKEIQKLSSESELKELNKKIVKRAGNMAKEQATGNIRKKAYSKNPMKSGRRGSRTGQHAADNVPQKGTTQTGNYAQVIGWDKADTSPFFYMKFQEWGTSTAPIQTAKEFMLETAHQVYPQFKNIAEEEYEKVLKEKLGG